MMKKALTMIMCVTYSQFCRVIIAWINNGQVALTGRPGHWRGARVLSDVMEAPAAVGKDNGRPKKTPKPWR